MHRFSRCLCSWFSCVRVCALLDLVLSDCGRVLRILSKLAEFLTGSSPAPDTQTKTHSSHMRYTVKTQKQLIKLLKLNRKKQSEKQEAACNRQEEKDSLQTIDLYRSFFQYWIIEFYKLQFIIPAHFKFCKEYKYTV